MEAEWHAAKRYPELFGSVRRTSKLKQEFSEQLVRRLKRTWCTIGQAALFFQVGRLHHRGNRLLTISSRSRVECLHFEMHHFDDGAAVQRQIVKLRLGTIRTGAVA